MLGAFDVSDLIRWIFGHIVEVMAVIAILAGAARAAAAKRRGSASGTPGQMSAPRPRRREEESDLETRVRRNFEEMMRRRAAAAPQPPARTPPAAAPRRVDYDERAHAEPTSTEGLRIPEGARQAEPIWQTEGPRPKVVVVRKPGERSVHLAAAAEAVKGNVRSAAHARELKRALARDLRRVAVDRAAIRRVVLLREVLDPPVALRG